MNDARRPLLTMRMRSSCVRQPDSSSASRKKKSLPVSRSKRQMLDRTPKMCISWGQRHRRFLLEFRHERGPRERREALL